MESSPPPSYASAKSAGKWNVKDRKTLLRLITTLFSFIGIFLQIGVWVVVLKTPYYENAPWYGFDDISLFGFSFIWNAAELLTIRIRKDKGGIHPAAHVTFDLILWLGFLTSAIIQICVSYGYWLSIVASVIGIACCILHFVLFVGACREVDRQRKLKLAYSIPPGMALVPLKTLAELQNTTCAICGGSKICDESKIDGDLKV